MLIIYVLKNNKQLQSQSFGPAQFYRSQADDDFYLRGNLIWRECHRQESAFLCRVDAL